MTGLITAIFGTTTAKSQFFMADEYLFDQSSTSALETTLKISEFSPLLRSFKNVAFLIRKLPWKVANRVNQQETDIKRQVWKG